MPSKRCRATTYAMSRGPGELQRWILETLQQSSVALSSADFREEWGWRISIGKRLRKKLPAKVVKRLRPKEPSRKIAFDRTTFQDDPEFEKLGEVFRETFLELHTLSTFEGAPVVSAIIRRYTFR